VSPLETDIIAQRCEEVFAIIDQWPGCTLDDIAEHLGWAKDTVKTYVKRLRASGRVLHGQRYVRTAPHGKVQVVDGEDHERGRLEARIMALLTRKPEGGIFIIDHLCNQDREDSVPTRDRDVRRALARLSAAGMIASTRYTIWPSMTRAAKGWRPPHVPARREAA